MIYDIQKASLLKRFAAALLDFFLVVILAVGVMWLMSLITGIGKYADLLQGYYDEYGEKYGVNFSISEEDYNQLSQAEKDRYDDVYQMIFKEHPDAAAAYVKTQRYPLLIISVGILIPALVFEFLIPLLLKNGRTVGKRVFNLGVVFKNSVKMSNFALFVRAVLGKYTIAMMIPALLLYMSFTGILGYVGLIVLGLFVVLQLVIFFATKNRLFIHDVLANTVVVDMQTQMVFDTYDELVQCVEAAHAEQASKAEYK